jgi:hypothetical protein
MNPPDNAATSYTYSTAGPNHSRLSSHRIGKALHQVHTFDDWTKSLEILALVRRSAWWLVTLRCVVVTSAAPNAA